MMIVSCRLRNIGNMLMPTVVLTNRPSHASTLSMSTPTTPLATMCASAFSLIKETVRPHLLDKSGNINSSLGPINIKF